MKDAYSFHADEASLDATYQDMYNAYSRIFKRVGINARPVVADSGAIGGNHTHEFMALSEIGEDTIVYSNESEYALILKRQKSFIILLKHTETAELTKLKHLMLKLQELADFLNRPLDEIVKTMIFKVDGEFIMVLLEAIMN